MGMAALELTTRGGNVDYQRLRIGDLREIARQNHPEHTDEAARVFVERILDIEVERRTQLDDRLQGYGNISSTGLLGELPGCTIGIREPMAAMYDQSIKMHRSHEAARRFIQTACVPDRQLLALMIRSAKKDRRVSGAWGASYQQVLANLGFYAQMLDWPPPVAQSLFSNVASLKLAATRGMSTLVLQVKGEEGK